MRLGVKHANQQTVIRSDFSGGLNTATTVDGIAENQLAEVVNLEIDHSMGRLKTVGGTEDVIRIDDIFAVVYDSINRKALVVKTDRRVYVADLAAKTIDGANIGTLTGQEYPKYASWEDGVLIASGGKLQYYNGSQLVTLTNAPANSDEVYIRASRVVVSYGSTVHYSNVGDEATWTEDSGDDSTSKFVEAGYKDGGKFVGIVSLSSDMLLIKNNRRIYRLSGEYPDWSISEISRNIECRGRMAFCSVADAVFIVGHNTVAIIQPTSNYGDMAPANAATLVTKNIQTLPDGVMVRYVPPLSQVWLIAGKGVMMYDLTSQSWFTRQFNSPVLDVFCVGEETYVVKGDRIARIVEGTFLDDGAMLQWSFKGQRMISQHDFLLKRTQITVIPLAHLLYTGHITVGAVIVDFPVPIMLQKIYHNYSKIWRNRVKIMLAARSKGVYVSGDKIYGNPELIYGNTKIIYQHHTYIKANRNVFRSKHLDFAGFGSGAFALHSIVMDIAEV